ncbi:isoprenyl transferase [Aquipuribacter nitratireducens]|uniref:Isoprenyl transferase n=1 Tax=Aquipuribacter nitratireducens TaxID=650104 RepID=A0ABW0GHJ3_9MICO
MGLRVLAYRAYQRVLRSRLAPSALPRHVGVIIDGNRRWAAAYGATPRHGHAAGADKVVEFLGWCDEVGIDVVTLWLLSTDNVTARKSAELDALLEIIPDLVDRLAETGRWHVNPVGRLDLLPAPIAARLKEVGEATAAIDGITVNLAIGYGGRQEITDAVRSLLAEHAERGTPLHELADTLDVADISRHLYTRGQPDPDFVIRTSGEQRLSGFLLWQSAHSEYWFCEAYWPEFRKVDFLRALRSYSTRHRRFGS